jgi:hypothetical protein
MSNTRPGEVKGGGRRGYSHGRGVQSRGGGDCGRGIGGGSGIRAGFAPRDPERVEVFG